MPGKVLIGIFVCFFIIQGLKYNLNTTNNEKDFQKMSCIFQLLQGTSLLLRTAELFPWAKSIHIGKINRPSALALPYFFPLGCIKSCMVHLASSECIKCLCLIYWAVENDTRSHPWLVCVLLLDSQASGGCRSLLSWKQCSGSRSHIEMKVIYAFSYSKLTVTSKLKTGRKHNIAYVPLLFLSSPQCPHLGHKLNANT